VFEGIRVGVFDGISCRAGAAQMLGRDLHVVEASTEQELETALAARGGKFVATLGTRAADNASHWLS
jgi:hypothetical protein